MALTKVIGAGLGTVTEDQVFGGATPTVTIGDAGAEDAKIVFDGNAQDYHIGLDDSADTLVIGKGSALGTTTAMSFDANGIITKPLQPAFLARPSSAQTNIAVGGGETLVVFGTEVFDRGANFASSVFTAPVEGLYSFQAMLRLESLDSASNYYYINIFTSNRYYHYMFDPDFGQDQIYWQVTLTALADMDANDIAKIMIYQGNGTQQTDISTLSHFSGYLVA
jgi:hypothetical protein